MNAQDLMKTIALAASLPGDNAARVAYMAALPELVDAIERADGQAVKRAGLLAWCKLEDLLTEAGVRREGNALRAIQEDLLMLAVNR